MSDFLSNFAGSLYSTIMYFTFGNMRNRFTTYIIAALIGTLSACTHYSEKDATLVCGVPVKGTPWELAATVADHGEGGFVPECVTVYGEKAYIKGWIDTNGWKEPYRELPYVDGLLPAEIWCDLENGQVTHAGLYCEILDKE